MHRVIPLALVLLGVIAFVYPVVATLYNDSRQREAAERYSAQVQAAPAEQLDHELALARDYNRDLESAPILDPWLSKVSNPGSDAYRRYLSTLAGFSAMGRLRVPAVGIDLPIYHGTSDDVMAKGVGHLYGTSLPVGGPGTHAVLTSHTGLANAKLFDNLKQAKDGDLLQIDVLGQTRTYQVDQIKIVLPDDASDLKKVDGEDLITLVTCTPYAVNTHRLLVRGHRVADSADTAAAATRNRAAAVPSWMYQLLVGAGVGLLALVAMWVTPGRRKKRRAKAVTPPTSTSVDAPMDRPPPLPTERSSRSPATG
jgi:sortase A